MNISTENSACDPIPNTRFLTAICAMLPAAAMAAAHWFPWRRVFRRDLHRLEAYGIGTGAIVGTALLAISRSNGSRTDHSRMLLTATVAAGIATTVGYAVDEFVRLRAEVAGLKAERESINGRL